MNENSKPPVHPTTINSWLTRAATRLSEAGIPSMRLDAELILAHVLNKDRTWLVSHADDELTDGQLIHQANTLLTKRLHRLPLAYLIGTKEFYGRDFTVNEHVLIPRPETETMIELLVRIADDTPGRLIDVGTGTGCIAITAKLELPQLDVLAVDISPQALEVAAGNAARLGADVTLIESDLLSKADGQFDFIVSNPPYVNPEWERSPETEFEPSLALFAEEKGFAIIRRLIDESSIALKPGGYLLIEADPEQHELIKETGAAYGLRFVEQEVYIVVLCKD